MTISIDIEINATTASAVAEVTKLSQANRETVTAGDLAGLTMKELTKETQRVAAATIENTVAVRKAKDATTDLKLTQDAFGKSSTEAAAAQARLSAAEKEVARTSAVCADGLTRVAVAVGQVGKDADGTMTPAAARATKQLASMSAQAEKNVDDMKRLELQSKKGGGGFDLMGMASGKLMSVLGPAALAGTVMGLASWLGEAAEATLQYETAIKNLPFSLNSAQEATHGLMSESSLAVAASQALALGVVKTEADFANLASDAAKIALKLGTSTDQMLGDLTSALGRGSAAILDNAGIIVKTSEAQEAYASSIGKTVSELTEMEKKQAFQLAAMAAIKKSAGETKVEYDSNAAAISRLKVTTGDAWESMKRGTVDYFGEKLRETTTGYGILRDAIRGTTDAEIELQAAAQEAEDALTREAMRAEGWSKGFKDLASSSSLAAANMLGFGNVLARFTNPAIIEEGKALLAQEEKKKNLLTEEAVQAERIEKAMKKIASENEAFLDQQAYDALKGPQPAKAEKKKGGAKKKKAEVMDPGDVARARIFDGRELGDSVSNEAAWTQVQIEEDAAKALYDVQTAALERELELFDARAQAGEEAQVAREALLARRQEVEEDYAKEQFRQAREDAKREAATTKMEALEHKRRVSTLRLAAKEEEKERAKQAQSMEKVASLVGDVSNTMVDTLWTAATEGEAAGAKMLADYLKQTAKKQVIEAAVMAAKGVSMLATVYGAPLAPPYFLAAGKHLAVAAAAGGAAIGLGAAAGGGGGGGAARPEAASDDGMTERQKNAKAERDDAKSNFEWDGSAWGPKDRTKSFDGGGSSKPEREALTAQDMPLSYDSASKNPTTSAAQPNVYNITFQGGMWASGGPEKAAQEITSLLRKQGAAGRR